MLYFLLLFKKVVGVFLNKHLVLYGAIGFYGLSIDFSLFYLLREKLFWHYQLANFTSVSLTITNNFLLNFFFNYKKKEFFWQRLVSFFSIGLAGWLLSALLMFTFFSILKINLYISKGITIAMVAFSQYLLNHFITFK